MKKTSLMLGAFAGALMIATATSASAAWYDDTKVDGRIYYDFTSKDAKSSTGKKTDSTGFDVSRFYIGVTHKFNDQFYANITTDMTYSNGTSNVETFVKKAYFGSKFNDMADLRIGSSDMSWVPYAENIYGYRYFEKTLNDRSGFANSADWGAHLSGKLNDIFDYQLDAVNGGGYKNPSRSQNVDFEGRLSAKYGNFNAAVGGYNGKMGKETLSNGVNTNARTVDRTNALIAYKADQFTIGAEVANIHNAGGVLASAAATKSSASSIFGNYRFNPQIAAFARYDDVKPKGGLEDRFSLVGVSYTPAKNIDFALGYKNDKVKGGTKTNEIGVWGQYKF